MTAPSRSQPNNAGPEWPQAGDQMRFLGRNGYDWQLKKANEIFRVDELYTVEDCEVQSFSHSIKFKEVEGRYNGVMFERAHQPTIDFASPEESIEYDNAATATDQIAALKARIKELEAELVSCRACRATVSCVSRDEAMKKEGS